MPTINIRKSTKEDLYTIMSHELKSKIKSDPKHAMLQMAKNKFGISFDSLIVKLAQEYKRNHQITKSPNHLS